jgi:predicted nucleic acid-binding protein
VRAADEDALAEAIEASVRHRLAFWDALLWATVRRAGCRLLLSEDFQDGWSLGGVTVLDPFAPANAAALDAALPTRRA